MLFEKHKIEFRGNNKHTMRLSVAPYNQSSLRMHYIQACLLTKQNLFWCFDAGLEHMAARSRGNGTNFDWLRKSCDISPCDLSPDGNPEKYEMPMKSAILKSNGQIFIPW